MKASHVRSRQAISTTLEAVHKVAPGLKRTSQIEQEPRYAERRAFGGAAPKVTPFREVQLPFNVGRLYHTWGDLVCTASNVLEIAWQDRAWDDVVQIVVHSSTGNTSPERTSRSPGPIPRTNPDQDLPLEAPGGNSL